MIIITNNFYFVKEVFMPGPGGGSRGGGFSGGSRVDAANRASSLLERTSQIIGGAVGTTISDISSGFSSGLKRALPDQSAISGNTNTITDSSVVSDSSTAGNSSWSCSDASTTTSSALSCSSTSCSCGSSTGCSGKTMPFS